METKLITLEAFGNHTWARITCHVVASDPTVTEETVFHIRLDLIALIEQLLGVDWKRAVTAAAGWPVDGSANLNAAVIERATPKVTLIKYVKSQTGMSLKRAKDLVDGICNWKENDAITLRLQTERVVWLFELKQPLQS